MKILLKLDSAELKLNLRFINNTFCTMKNGLAGATATE